MRFGVQEEGRAAVGRCGGRLSAVAAGHSAGQGLDPDNDNEPVQVPSDDNAKFCSLAFKLWSDPLSASWCSSAFIPAR